MAILFLTEMLQFFGFLWCPGIFLHRKTSPNPFVLGPSGTAPKAVQPKRTVPSVAQHIPWSSAETLFYCARRPVPVTCFSIGALA